MGLAFFVTLLLCTALVVGFMVYGMFWGLAQLAGQARWVWAQVRANVEAGV